MSLSRTRLRGRAAVADHFRPRRFQALQVPNYIGAPVSVTDYADSYHGSLVNSEWFKLRRWLLMIAGDCSARRFEEVQTTQRIVNAGLT
jgi:hypothetical protein